MLTTDWKTWCRLCGGVNGKELKLDTIESVSNILRNCIRISLSGTADNLSVVCQDCLDLVLNVEKFTLRYAKVSKMFVELLNGKVPSVKAVRQKYCLPESNDCRNSKTLETREYHQSTSTKVDIPCDDVKFFETQLMDEDLLHTKIEEPVDGFRSTDEDDSNNDNTFCEPGCNKPKLQLKTVDSQSKPKTSKHSNKTKSTQSTAKKRNISTDQKPKSANRKYVQGSDVCCHLCDITFDQHRLYIRHMREKHSPEVLLFACPQCEKFFASEKKMLQHAASHRPVEQKKIHPCPECDRTFCRAENVHLHIRSVHMGVRSFVCEECGKAWATKQQLQKHQLMHTDARPFKCGDCSKCFKDSTSLKKHLEIHSTVSFECLLCGQRSSTRYTLREHMLVHSDEKRYKCQYCGNSFKRYKTLKNHLILHTGMRPYACPFCDITYSNEPNLRAHKKKCHPVENTDIE